MSQAARVNELPRGRRGGRLRVRVPRGLRWRSAAVLGVLCVLLGAVLAAVLASAIGFVVQALVHSVGNGP